MLFFLGEWWWWWIILIGGLVLWCGVFFFLEDDGGVDYCVQANVSNDETAAWPVANPVVTCASVSDVGYPSNFVADPFLFIQVIIIIIGSCCHLWFPPSSRFYLVLLILWNSFSTFPLLFLMCLQFLPEKSYLFLILHTVLFAKSGFGFSYESVGRERFGFRTCMETVKSNTSCYL